MTNALALLGSTGSIGTQVLDVIRHFPHLFTIEGLAAGSNLNKLVEQIKEFKPSQVSIADESKIPALKQLLSEQVPDFSGELVYGREGLKQIAASQTADTVVVGLVGMRGLEPSLAALSANKKLITANKETFVAGGHLIKPYLGNEKNKVVPIDSEHVALHQCLGDRPPAAVEKLYLTASGGPFRNHSKEAMASVTLDEALKHPNWVMGSKITIDSATMMNKGLEVIEAHWLFNMPYERIQIIVHPESIAHSGIRFIDGTLLMQLAPPDMRGPIQYALSYPKQFANPEPSTHLDLLTVSQLNFSKPDPDRFPCIRLAYQAGEAGGSMPAVLNGADEAAVKLFLDGKIPFLHIAKLIEATMTAHQQDGVMPAPQLEDIQQIDRWAREFVENHLVAM